MQSGKAVSDTEKTIEEFEGLSIDGPLESSASTTSSSGSEATQKIQDAVDYIDAVKSRVSEDEPEVYLKFLVLMKDFHNERIDTAGVAERIKQLFKEYPDLIKGFDKFLPPGYSTSDRSEDKQDKDDDSGDSGTASPGGGSRVATPTSEVVQEAGAMPQPTIAYIQRVKQQCDTETWEHFMVILTRRFKEPEHFNDEDVIKDVEELFEDHPELIPGFRTFLEEGKQKRAGAGNGSSAVVERCT